MRKLTNMTPNYCLSAILFALLFNLSQVSSHINKNHHQAQNRSSQSSITRSQLEKSGWQMVSDGEASIFDLNINNLYEDGNKGTRNPLIDRQNKTEIPLNHLAEKSRLQTESKPVDWDDDDLNGEKHETTVGRGNPNRDLNYLLMVNGDQKSSPPASTATPISNRKNRKNNSKNKLVYHGQVRRNGTSKVVDGIKLHINTHKPVTISRKIPFSEGKSETLTILTPVHSETRLEKPLPKEKESKRTISEILAIDEGIGANKWPQPLELQDSSNWKPISIASSSTISQTRVRHLGRLNKSTKLIDDMKVNSRPRSVKVNETLLLADQKWKPISRGQKSYLDFARHAARRINIRENTTKRILDSSPIVYGKVKTFFDDQPPVSSLSPLEEPFDDDGLIVMPTAKTTSTTESSLSPSASSRLKARVESSLLPLPKWKPLDMIVTTTLAPTTTIAEDMSITTKTTSQPTTTLPPLTTFSSTRSHLSSSNSWQPSSNSSLESAQRSASDLNYIYSSQPQPQQLQQPLIQPQVASSGSAYYSSYVMPSSQPTIVEQQPAPNAPIIDTTSGQLPEMIAERAPETSPVVQSDGYSMPQSVAQFQPIQPLPTRMPSSYYDSSYANSYSSSYVQPPPRFQQPAVQQQQHYVQPQPQRQVVLPSQAPQVVRQEHHYHYYNQQQQTQRQQQQVQQQDTQFDRSQQSQSNNAQQQTIIREIQPLLISQPIVAPSSTTTTTPQPAQIIREIVKEIPVQTMPIQPMQVSRIILPQTVSVQREQMPQYQQVRELDSPLQFAYAPAQRIIRTISNNIPSLNIRIPQMTTLPQIRFPVPAMPLPVRALASNPASVTRQTGSFLIPPMPKKTTTYLTETQAMPTHTTIMQTTQYTPATRTTVYTTDHQAPPQALDATRSTSGVYKARRRKR